jgi:hypothetical protein
VANILGSALSETLKQLAGGVIVLLILLTFVPFEIILLIVVAYGAVYVFARYFWPKIFFQNAGERLSADGHIERKNVFNQLAVYPVDESKSRGGRGYIDLDAKLYVLVAPRSVLREGEETTPVSTHQAAAKACNDYGLSWRLLTYDEGMELSDRLIEAAEQLNYSVEKKSSKLLGKIAGQNLTKTYNSKFWPLLYGTTEPENRHGQNTCFAYGVDYDRDDDTDQVFEPKKIIERVTPQNEYMLTVCADLNGVIREEEFFANREIGGAPGEMGKLINSIEEKEQDSPGDT